MRLVSNSRLRLRPSIKQFRDSRLRLWECLRRDRDESLVSSRSEKWSRLRVSPTPVTHPLRTKIFHSPSGQLASGNKILTLPWDNKACGLRRKKNEKSFCHPSVPPSFGISCQIKSTFVFAEAKTFNEGNYKVCTGLDWCIFPE